MKSIKYKLALLLILFTTTACEMGKEQISNFFRSQPNQEGPIPLQEFPEWNPADEEAEEAILQGDIGGAIDAYVAPKSESADCARAPASEKSAESCEDTFNNKKVLYIGDSHSYLRSEKGSRMGNQVANKVKGCGASEFHYRSFCGARPSNWHDGKRPKTSCGFSSMGSDGFKTATKGEGDNLEKLIEDTNAEHVMINLGDNMFSWGRENGKMVSSIKSPQSIVSEVKKLVAELAPNQECTWIGPVYHSSGSTYKKLNTSVDQMYELIKEGLDGRCRLVDSRPYFSSTAPNDGLHLVESESGVWGQKIADSL